MVMTEESIKEMVFSGLESHCYGWHRYDDECSVEEMKRDAKKTAEYLAANIKVLFGREARDYIKSNDHDHGSWFLDCFSGEIYGF